LRQPQLAQNTLAFGWIAAAATRNLEKKWEIEISPEFGRDHVARGSPKTPSPPRARVGKAPSKYSVLQEIMSQHFHIW